MLYVKIKQMIERMQLLKLVKEHFAEGEVTLSSGKKSSYYIDGKMVTLSAEGAYLTAQVLKPRLEEDRITAIGGMMIGADPIAGAVSALSYNWDRKINAFIVRKQQKSHGKLKSIEGPLSASDTVALIDDVVTTGGSVIEAAEQVELTGAKIKVVYALVDRLEGARQNFEEKGYAFKPIFTLDDLRS